MLCLVGQNFKYMHDYTNCSVLLCCIHIYTVYATCSHHICILIYTYYIIIYSFIQAISIAPLQVYYYSEALPAQHGYCVGVSRWSATGNTHTCVYINHIMYNMQQFWNIALGSCYAANVHLTGVWCIHCLSLGCSQCLCSCPVWEPFEVFLFC